MESSRTWSFVSVCALLGVTACQLSVHSPIRATNARHTEVDAKEKVTLQQLNTVYERGSDAQRRGAHEEAISEFRAALLIKGLPPKLSGFAGFLYYNIACSEARLGRRAEALASLSLAAKHQYADAGHARVDEDLESLRDKPDFEAVLQAFAENARKLRIYDLVISDSPDLGWSELHRFEDIESAPFVELRTKYRLGAVVAGARTELEKQLALVSWVHNRWEHSGLNEPTHEDALTILREVDAGRRFRCVEYSVVLTQVLQAMGFPARVVGLRVDGASFGIGKGHVVSEVWNNDLQKWIIVDGQNNGTWQVGGTPLSAIEIRETRHANAESLRFVLAPSKWMVQKPEATQRAEWVAYFEHLTFRFDNVQPAGADTAVKKIDLLYPREKYELLFQGSVDKNHIQTPSFEKAYPTLGRVHVDLSVREAGKPEVQLEFQNSMPWFSHYRVRQNGIESDTEQTAMKWLLTQGKNEIVISAVNAMKVEGKPTTIVLNFIPPG